MPLPMAVTDSMFLLAESREHPTHVGGLQLFRLPEDAGPDYVSGFYQALLARTEISAGMRRRPYRSPATLGQWSWTDDRDVELDYHVRLSALPSPGRVRELLALVSRLHGTLLDRHRPLWEFHLVEGLSDRRFATYTKVHHALMDGVTAMRVLTRGLSTDPDGPARPPWAPRQRGPAGGTSAGGAGKAIAAVRDVAARAADVAGTPPAVANALVGMARDNGATRPFDAPPTMFNVPIGGARRFVGQSWPLERVRAIGVAADATVNDVAVAMSAGALRQYLLDRDALPDRPLVAMLPVSLRGTEQASGNGGNGASSTASSNTAGQGNAVGAILCDLATEQADPAVRLARIRASTRSGKGMLRGMSPFQVLALSGLLAGGVVLAPIPGVGRFAPPPFNIIISNVPGSREVRYWDAAELLETYPLSIPVDGQAVNITLTSYVDKLAFGIVGCRRSVPHLQRMIDHLDAELSALEAAVR
ncbi:MAG: diacylglycerol O-acyltransferase / wax synthase [Pseudonocardiales bacterium]|jgi:WS/DGAT/MGAT family acyltransferase|nr:diacylglycerol O-acyltransferase / wax synthase [Pseudonocardiales bacterium]MDT7752888.1 diacylglycerol O-acyltransferase / wax synthase [Pseudonocardiales bacterium]